VNLADPEKIKEFTGKYFNSDHGMAIQLRVLEYGARPPAMVEMGPEGPAAWTEDFTEPGMHIVCAGTPHRTPFRYGYWHKGCVDEVFIWQPPAPDRTGFLIVLERQRGAGDTDSFQWYCQHCNELLYSVVTESGNAVVESGDPAGWFDATVEGIIRGVDEFNGDPALRVCRKCQAEHPLAYHLPIDAFPHTEEQESARDVW